MTLDLLSFLLGATIASAAAFFILQTKRRVWQTIPHEALKQNNELFLQMANARFQELHSTSKNDLDQKESAIAALVSPVEKRLEKMDEAIREIEKSRIGAYSELKQQVAGLLDSQHLLRGETSNLVRALRTPDVRGRWGEIQLRRVAELAGMIEHCDFAEQSTMMQDDKRLRPDMIVNLPGGKTIIIDAKTPIDAWLDACNDQLSDEARQEAVLRHARHVRKHLQDLGTKKYYDTLPGSPELVIMFLPDEGAFSAALRSDTTLIEFGAEQRVIPATPITLIALLRTIHYGWRQELLANEARDIATLGRDVLERLARFGDHLGSMGNALGKAVQYYNQGIQHLDTKVWPSLRKLQDKGVHSKIELQDTKTIDLAPARSAAPEYENQNDDAVKPIRLASSS